MPRPSDARSRFIETAATLFRRNGYNGVGLSQVIAASGAPKGSFYHHFPGGKEDLGEEAIRLAGRQIGRLLDRSFGEAASFEAGAAALVTALGDHLAASGWTEGCPVAAMLDAGPTSERLAGVLREIVDGWFDAVAGHAARLGQEPDAARARAERFLVMLEGAWFLARLRRSTEPLRLAAET